MNRITYQAFDERICATMSSRSDQATIQSSYSQTVKSTQYNLRHIKEKYKIVSKLRDQLLEAALNLDLTKLKENATATDYKAELTKANNYKFTLEDFGITGTMSDPNDSKKTVPALYVGWTLDKVIQDLGLSDVFANGNLKYIEYNGKMHQVHAFKDRTGNLAFHDFGYGDAQNDSYYNAGQIQASITNHLDAFNSLTGSKYVISGDPLYYIIVNNLYTDIEYSMVPVDDNFKAFNLSMLKSATERGFMFWPEIYNSRAEAGTNDTTASDFISDQTDEAKLNKSVIYWCKQQDPTVTAESLSNTLKRMYKDIEKLTTSLKARTSEVSVYSQDSNEMLSGYGETLKSFTTKR